MVPPSRRMGAGSGVKSLARYGAPIGRQFRRAGASAVRSGGQFDDRRDMGDDYVSVEHLVVALADQIGVTRNALRNHSNCSRPASSRPSRR
jgi:hypothetical protein